MITGLFDIALNALKVAQQGLEVAGNNIANVESAGYTRRDIVADQLPYNRGAVVREIKREINPFVSRAWQDSLGLLGYYKTKDEILNELEGVFNEINSGGIKQALQDFWDAWQMVSNDSADISLRVSLLQRSKALADSIRTKKSQLLSTRSFIDPEIETLIQHVNSMSERLSELNYKIKFGKTAKQDINNLLDERDKILRELSELIGITSVKNPDGQVSVFLNGQAMVIDGQSFKIESQIGSDGNIRIIWDDSEDITDKVLGMGAGRLSAYLELRDRIIPEYIDKLNSFAYQLADQINTQHKLGYDLYGNQGEEFFKIDSEDPAGSIELNLDDPKKVAASSSASTLPSDNKNALSILEIRDKTIAGLNGMSIDNFYNHIITSIGDLRHTNGNFLKLQDTVVQEIQDHFDMTSGVNLDEEAANVIRYQYMYTASARLISVASKITEVIINMGA